MSSLYFLKFFAFPNLWVVIFSRLPPGILRPRIGSFVLLLSSVSEVILCRRAWCLSIIPHTPPFGNPFFHFFRLFFELCIHLLVFYNSKVWLSVLNSPYNILYKGLHARDHYLRSVRGDSFTTHFFGKIQYVGIKYSLTTTYSVSMFSGAKNRPSTRKLMT